MTRGERVIKFIESYCIVPEGNLVGQEITLDDFQKKFIIDVYDNPNSTRTAILSIARKNGKTGLIAALLLAHLVGPEAVLNSNLQSGARSRDQASQVFNYASKMVMLSPKLSQIVRIIPSGKRLIGLPMNTTYQALSADAKTAHGGSPIFALLDEVGQVKGSRDDFIDAITTSQGAYDNPLLIAISTQAAEDGDLLSIWIDDAIKSEDPHTVCHVYSAPDDAQLTDEAGWVSANPAMGTFRSKEDIRVNADKASRMPSFENTFRNLYLNQRVSTVSPFVSRDVWLSGKRDVLDFGDAPVWAGLDLSARTDLTALVLICYVNNEWQIKPYFWTPKTGLAERARRDRQPYDVWVNQGFMRTTEGATVDYGFVAKDICEILLGLNIQSIAYDRWRIDILNKELDNIGVELPLIEYGQGFKDMSVAIDSLEAELLNGRIVHGGHPVLTMCAANAVTQKDPAGNRKLDKSKATGRIDGMVALAMAFGAYGKKSVEEGDLDGFINEPIMVG